MSPTASSDSSAASPGDRARLSDLPEVARYKRRRRFWAIIAGSLCVLVLLSAKPGYRAFKGWRCRSLAAESIQCLNNGKQEEAFKLARAAYQLRPHEPNAIRAVAKAMSNIGDGASALSFWAQLLKSDAATEIDRRECAETALRVGALDVASSQVTTLLASQAEVPENHLLAARVQAARGDLQLAIRHSHHAVELDLSNHPVALLLAELQLKVPESRQKGLHRLRVIASTDSPAALRALSILAALPDLPLPELPSLSERLLHHPLAKLPQHLQAVELQIRHQPERRQAILEDAEKRYTTKDPDALRQFASWLIGQREPHRALHLIPEARALTRRDLTLVRLDAQAAAGDWQAILDLLGRERLPLEAALVNLFRARCWTELGDVSKAKSSWSAAIAAAAGDANTIAYIGSYAEKTQQLNYAKQAYRKLTENPKTARIAYTSLLRVTPKEDTHAVRDILVEMVACWPKDHALTNDLAYFNALLKSDLPQMRERASELVKAFPERLPHRTSLALVELRLGNSPSALKVYDSLRVDWKTAAQEAKLVYAAVLHANHRTPEAVSLVAMIDPKTLRPEEQGLHSQVLSD